MFGLLIFPDLFYNKYVLYLYEKRETLFISKLQKQADKN